MSRAPPPTSEGELFSRASELAGTTLGELAAAWRLTVPPDLRRAKGWTGQLLERALGATAASRAEPDFTGLGVELKTLPITAEGRPCESTFVCTVPLREIGTTEWADSRVRKKLSRVLWVPVEGRREVPVAVRRIGQSLLWSPDEDDEACLRSDWERLAGLIGCGNLDSVTGHIGGVLQLRPKAAHGRVRRRGLGAGDEPEWVLPRGFYLRPSFTGGLMRRNFAMKDRADD